MREPIRIHWPFLLAAPECFLCLCRLTVQAAKSHCAWWPEVPGDSCLPRDNPAAWGPQLGAILASRGQNVCRHFWLSPLGGVWDAGIVQVRARDAAEHPTVPRPDHCNMEQRTIPKMAVGSGLRNAPYSITHRQGSISTPVPWCLIWVILGRALQMLPWVGAKLPSSEVCLLCYPCLVPFSSPSPSLLPHQLVLRALPNKPLHTNHHLRAALWATTHNNTYQWILRTWRGGGY